MLMSRKLIRYRSPDGLLLCALGILSSLLRFVFVASPESHAVARTPYTRLTLHLYPCFFVPYSVRVPPRSPVGVARTT
jgi:hypothetical protein